MLKKYAKLLVEYSLYLQKGETLYISTTTLAEPLVSEIYSIAIQKGAHVYVNFEFAGKNESFYKYANEDQLKRAPEFHKYAMEKYDAYLYIKAPYISSFIPDTDKRTIRSESLKDINQTYFRRTANGSMKRSLCLYPTSEGAQLANMSLHEYEKFVYRGCKLYDENPTESWKKLSQSQQKFVDLLNSKNLIRYVNEKSDIQFSIEGRTWINSDGKTNMPSGEVFTSPVENSVNGTVFFDYPSTYMGTQVQGIELKVENGEVKAWKAEKGQLFLDKIMNIPGARYFGEAAIGTNYDIQKATNNILFDEKIGGSIHMALGQSYGQTGGKNQSTIHWDMISDMKKGGQIFADNELIYENGKFIF